MSLLATILIIIVIIQHLFFMYFEMFAWETIGRKVFRGFPKELFPATRTLAANQGLYNGFLAAGLVWTFFIEDPVWRFNVSVFFLSCVFVAGLYGGWSVNKRVFMIQGLPALFALLLLYLAI